MYDYKSLRKIITLLAVLFGVVLVVLVVTSQPLNKFAWLSVLLLAVVGVFFLQSAAFVRSYMRWEENEHEAAAEKYKNGARKSND